MNVENITKSNMKFTERELDILGTAYQHSWEQKISFIKDLPVGEAGYIIDELSYWHIPITNNVSEETAREIADYLFIADKLNNTWNHGDANMWRCLFYLIPYFEKRMSWVINDLRREFKFEKRNVTNYKEKMIDYYVKRIVTYAVYRAYEILYYNCNASKELKSILTEYGDYYESLRKIE